MKRYLASAFIGLASMASLQAFTFQVDINPGDTVVGDDGVSPWSGSVFLGYFAAGTNFANSFADLDSSFFAINQGFVDGSGFRLTNTVPGSGTWANGELDGNAGTPDWTSSAGQDSNWDNATGFGGKDMTLVFVNGGPYADNFVGTPNANLFNSITSYLIVDTGNQFSSAALSGLGTTFAAVSASDQVLKASGNSQVVPEPASALLLLGGLGALAFRRHRA